LIFILDFFISSMQNSVTSMQYHILRFTVSDILLDSRTSSLLLSDLLLSHCASTILYTKTGVSCHQSFIVVSFKVSQSDFHKQWSLLLNLSLQMPITNNTVAVHKSDYGLNLHFFDQIKNLSYCERVKKVINESN